MSASTNVDWSRFLEWAARYYEWDGFDREERDYKLEIASRVGEARSLLEANDDSWRDHLASAFKWSRNNLTPWQSHARFLDWLDAHPDAGKTAIAHLWDDESDPIESIGLFLAEIPSSDLSGPGARLAIASFILMGRDPSQFPIYRPTPVAAAKRLVGWPDAADDSEGSRYADALAFFDAMRAAALDRGLELRDRLDAQSLAWAITKNRPPPEWPVEDQRAFREYRGDNMSGVPGSLSLSEAVRAWDREAAAEKIELAAAERADFIERFPPDVWPDLPLENYALGVPGSAEGFSGRIEFHANNCGSIKGGSARKHLIYLRNAGGWYFESRYASETEAWDAVRHGFADLVALCSQQRFDEVDEIESLFGAPVVRGKTCWMYFPDELMPIYAESHLHYWLRIFDIAADDAGPVGKSRRLFEKLTSLDEFSGWQPIEIMAFLYDWADPNPSHTIVKIAPGEGAVLWPECLHDANIRVGWDELGDLTLYNDLDELKAAYAAQWPDHNSSTTTRACRGLHWFSHLATGDIVVANRGTKTVVGIGRVTSGYQFLPDLPTHRHTVEVDWFDTAERPVTFGSAWMPTIVKLKPAQYHEILQTGGDSIVPEPFPPVPQVHLEAERLLERSRQLIFYGPPGTGKTYSARRHAAWLVAGGSNTKEAALAFGGSEALAQIEADATRVEVSDQRPSWFVVANPRQWQWQSLFEQGVVDYQFGRLQRNFAEVTAGDRVYGYEATPTKRVIATAQIQTGLHLDAAGEQKILISGGEPVEDGPSWDDLRDDPVLSQSEPVVHRMQGSMFRLEPAEAARLDDLIGGSGDSDSPLRAVPQLTSVTFHPTYAYEDFIEGYKPVESGVGGLELQMRDGVFKRICRAAAADPDRPYVLVIDEINRGNVPKIFGELITLIEADKRGLSVTLPQSGESFVVPPNVFLIATMNTADRSIHVLDSALRRRFSFLELLPDPSILVGASVGTLPLDELLRELNTRIREQIGREKQIGHAILMDGERPLATPSDFALAFKYELLPLLQEYAYGDYTDLAMLVGDEVIDTTEQVPRAEVIDDPERLVTALATHLDITVA